MKTNQTFSAIKELMTLVGANSRYDALSHIEQIMSHQYSENVRLLNGLKDWVENSLVVTDKLEFMASVDQIVNVIAKQLDVKPTDLYSNSRRRELVAGRQYAYWIIGKCWPRVSITQIGRVFNKDHATVLHSNKAFYDMVETDDHYFNELQIIVKILNSSTDVNVLGAFVNLEHQRQKVLNEKAKRKTASREL